MSDYDDDVVDGEPPAIEPYEVLGLARDATADQVKSAYRKAALKNHPGALPRLVASSRRRRRRRVAR